jgi:nitrate reductase delta subunit
MIRTFKVLSALITYPSEVLQAAARDMRAALSDEGIVSGEARHKLDLLIDDMATRDLFDLQERYVDLFDRNRSLSLHLFEHVHGESRDRGQAMVDLQVLYEKNGLTIRSGDLPDFVPLFLEFLATRPLGEACELIGQTAHILSALAERLARRGSPYEAVFRALVALADATPDEATVAAIMAEGNDDPADLAALDAEWEEAPVTFGPEATASGCKDDLIARLRAAKRPAAARA